ncbi:hypothetical protein PAXRUDRAFT_822110 [Paxillus rubicundulus Ve08.2h10]|uniref:GAR domain-containing protein n=1 Tax=Paxillus rubicundulus Ve08.2h10 TaxID=930991 RepID=A0A0D0DMN2_9AGAM|nr:hypothetical protein PAXRUDRAFT_822110 [Paxillus rubicundulus Ve08.2h10]
MSSDPSTSGAASVAQEFSPDMASGTPPPAVSRHAFPGAGLKDITQEDAHDPQDTQEETLESHEVIELQAFSERKAWIEEKIMFLEQLPPIEVFVGSDALRRSAESIPGLPTREQLQGWLAEHDRIEKETEIFDSGELKKLRMFTKAATQRHLSPEDTDLIELTLTTIYELDKLLHLLRDRSENLDLLGVRLTWEEQRAAAWADLKKLLSDIETFLITRARWSPSIYEFMAKPEEKPSTRRGSIASMASDTSATSNAGFSRSARFKLAELLSRDAAQFAGRASSLRHGRISAVGKVLDKLIENSRKPVPEELLDEQDRLEEKGINEMEDVGKFVMDIVTQWRKADELYVETMKDQSAAQNLLEEIETAKLYHPTPRQSSSFASRADTLVKRLALRGNPMSIPSLFPRPVHPLFPEQVSFNDSLIQSLSAEFANAADLVAKVDALAKEYRSSYEAVKGIDVLSQMADEVLSKFNAIIDRLSNGITGCDGDGSPPDLSSTTCLQPTAHAAFLTLLPVSLAEAEQTTSAVDKLICSYHLALLNLDRPGIELTFTQNARVLLGALVSARDRSHFLIDDTNARVGRLRVVRRVWSVMNDALAKLQNIQNEVGEMMERERWKKRVGTNTDPMTPETPPSQALDPSVPSSDMLERLDNVRQTLLHDITIPLASLSSTLEISLESFLTQTSDRLVGRLENVKQMVQLLDAIRSQSTIMVSLREEVDGLLVQIEDLNIRYDASIEEVLSGDLSLERIPEMQLELQIGASSLRDSVETFTDSIVRRVPFVSQSSCKQDSTTTFIRKKFSSADLRLGSSQLPVAIELPFTLTSLDDCVRADCNSFVMRLGGELEDLQRRAGHFQLARVAKDVDAAISSATGDLREVTQELKSLQSTLSSILQSDQKLQQLQALSHDVQGHSTENRSRLSRSLSLIRESLRQMESIPVSHDLHLYENLLASRRRAVDDLEIKVNSWSDRAAMLRGEVSETLLLESRRLDALRVQREKEAEEKRKQEERQRLAEQTRLRELDRVETEQRLRKQLAQEEAERLARGAAERQAREQVVHEEAERRLREQEREPQEAERQKATAVRQESEVKAMQVEERLELEKSEQVETEERELQSNKGIEKVSEHGWKKSTTVFTTSIAPAHLEEDVFGFRVAPSASPTKSQEESDLFDKIVSLRKRLRSIGINEVARPLGTSALAAQLPTLEQYGSMNARFASILSACTALPSSSLLLTTDLELRSLRTEVDASRDLVHRIRQLADFAGVANKCDMALSDLLEHIDSYPSPPTGPLSSTHVSTPRLPPEEQLSARIGFTRRTFAQVATYLQPINDDPRTIAEYQRIQQTWIELEEMANERVGGRKSRSSSVLSSGRDSSASVSVVSSQSGASRPSALNISHSRKASGYSSLSVRGSSRGKFLTPKHPPSRRAVSGSSDTYRRSSSKLSTTSVDTTRSVSGPIVSGSPTFSPSVSGSTFASRQRTASLSSNVASPAPRPYLMLRPRAETRSRVSPTPSDVSSTSRTNPPRSSSSMSTWARAPRQSFSRASRVQTPPRKTQPAPKKAYVANPQNKLDVAVGDVVNKLPVNINVEVVADTWKDQSGKYWIGDQEPKLCFCRILRSQTVMVRVGGGWQELSKFIKDHFADLFRIMPADPSPRVGSREEKWISSATLFEALEIITSPPPPRTPEPRGPFVPSFTLSTPSAHSPLSVKSTPTSGSPLAPLQFMRRADPDGPPIRPVTPSKPPLHRPRTNIPSTPARHALWRP